MPVRRNPRGAVTADVDDVAEEVPFPSERSPGTSSCQPMGSEHRKHVSQHRPPGGEFIP